MNIRKLFHWFNSIRAALLTVPMVGVLVLSSVLCLPANANPLNSVQTAGRQASLLIAKLPTLEEIEDNITSFAEQTQASLEKNIQEANEALQNLPEQLEESVARMNAADRQKTREAYAEAQKKLQASAKAYEEQAAKADQLEQELLQSARETRAGLKTDFETSKAELESSIKQGIENVKQSLRDTSEAYKVLAEDAQRANQEASDFLRAQIEQHTAALDRAMKKSDDSLKALLNEA